MSDVSKVFSAVDNVGAIYISGREGATDLLALREQNIGAILALSSCSLTTKYSQIAYKYFKVDDTEDFPIKDFFAPTFDFIDRYRYSTNVLVHCRAGISRSTTVVIAYLVRKFGYTMQKVIDMIKRKRFQVKIISFRLTPTLDSSDKFNNFNSNVFVDHLAKKNSQNIVPVLKNVGGHH